MRFSSLFMLLKLGFLLSFTCNAETELYRGIAAVEDQTSANQQIAMRTVMQDVLIKVSGSTEIIKHPVVRAALNKSQGYVRQYQYLRESEQLQVTVEFQTKRIDTLIRNAGFSPWTGRRPSTVLWLVEQTTSPLGRQRNVWSEDGEGFDSSIVKLAADRRGVTVIFPIMDLEEQQIINANDVWGRFDSVIMTASERYFAGQILSARLYQADNSEDDSWVLDWRIVNGQNQHQGQHINRSKDDALIWLINHVTDLVVNNLKKQNTANYASGNSLTLAVNNLNSLKDYVQASNLLSGLSSTTAIVLQSLTNTQAVFAITLASNVLDLQHELEMDGRLLKQKDEFGIPAEELEFFWRP